MTTHVQKNMEYCTTLSASKCHFLGRRADELKDVQGDLGFNSNRGLGFEVAGKSGRYSPISPGGDW